MREHIIEWLGAYHDGELRGSRLQQVEKHLDDCAFCRAELDELRSLTMLLKEPDPADDFLPVERFSANLALRLPRRSEETSGAQKTFSLAWWLVPVGLMLAWFFIDTTLSLSSFAALAADAGLLGSNFPWGQGAAVQMSWFSAVTNLFGSQLGTSGLALLGWLNDANIVLAQLAAPLIPQALIAAGYIGWLLAWWQRQNGSETARSEIHR